MSAQSITRPKLRLTEAERAALRNGPGFMGVVEFAPRAGRRGSRSVQPVRTRIFRTEAGAEAELAKLRFKELETRREVVPVNAGTTEV